MQFHSKYHCWLLEIKETRGKVRTKVQYQVSGFYHKRKLREQQNENPKASENGKRYRVTLPLKDNGGTKHVIILQLLSNNNSIHDCEL